MASYDPEDFYEAERLHQAARDGDTIEMSRLLSAGYSLEMFDYLEMAPLHCAAEEGKLEAVAWLLSHGANVNSNNEPRVGETPLSIAVQRGQVEVVELLLKSGADPDITGWMGLSARWRAHQRTEPSGKVIATLIEKYRPTRQYGSPR
jgi:ankyrin repeat protein